MNITHSTIATRGEGERTGRYGLTARRAVLALVAAAALMLAAPTAAQAVDGLTGPANLENTTIAGTTVDFGTTAQANLPATRTIFFWTNTASGGLGNTTRRHIAVNVSWVGSDYEYDSQSGGSGTRNCGINSQTANSVRLVMNYTGTGYKSCGFVFRLKSGTAVGTSSSTMTFTAAPSGSGGGGCTGPSSGTANCSAWSGGTQSGTATWSGTVQANNPVIQIWNSTNTAEQTVQNFPDTLSGTNSATYAFTVRNTGNVTVTNPSTQSITGPDASSFSITATTCGASLAPGATCTVTTRFNPPGAVTDVPRTATLNVSPTFSGTPYPDTATLNGNALAQTRIPALFDSTNTTPVSSFDYGSIGVGALANQTFTLRNTGNWPMAGPNVQSITGPDLGDFTISSTTCGATIAAGGTCQITVSFSPSAAGSRNATLNVTPTDATAGSPATIALTGFGVPPTFIPNIYDTAGTTLKPSHVFPDTVGTFQSAPYVFTLKNDGNATLLGTGAASQAITGPDAGEFTISGTTCGTSLLAGQSCTISVRFAPTSAAPDPGGVKTANLVVTTTNGDPISASSALSGNAIPATRVPNLYDTAGTTLKPDHTFPDTIGTAQSAAYVYTLKNDGNSTMTGISASIGGVDSSKFVISANTCGATLATGASCQISVRFAPTTEHPTGPETSNANLTVNTTNGIPASATSTLTGTSIPAISSPEIRDTGNTTILATRDLGNSATGETNQYVFTIRNNGNVNLTGLALSRMVISGPDASQFSRATTCPATLAPNATCTVTVSFSPTSLGPKSATLQVGSINGDPVGDPIPGDPGAFFNTSVNLTGTSVAPNPSIAIFDTPGTNELTTRNYGNVNSGSSSAYVFTVKNTGNVAVPNIVQAVTGPNAAEFARTTTCGATLARDASCTVTVTATPTRTGLRRAILTLTPGSASPQAAPKSVALSVDGVGLSIRNDVVDNLSGVNQKRWLDTLGMGGAAPTGDVASVAFQMDIGRAQSIEDVLISTSTTTNDTAPADGTFTPIPGGIGSVTIQRKPGSSQALVLASVPVSAVGPGVNIGNYGFSDGFLCLFNTATTNDRRIWFQVRGTNTDGVTPILSGKVGSIIRFTDARYACGGGPMLSKPEITSIGGTPQPDGTQNAVVNVGQNFDVAVEGFTRNSAYTGLRWRIRNTQTGDIFVRNSGNTAYQACADPCTGTNGQLLSIPASPSGTVQSFTVPGMPARGRWVVEGAPQGDGGDNNRIFRIATVLANSQVTDSPNISISGAPGPRPNTNSSWTLSATVSDTADPSNSFNTQGGRGQTIEWDLNNNQTDGPQGDGFEVRIDGDAGTALSAAELTQEFTTAGKTPGPYTIRARVTDNGALLSNDSSARSKIASVSFTINSPPVATSETIDFEADDTQPKDVEFKAVDADGDPYTVAVTPAIGNDGSVSGGGNTKQYSWPATYTGNDSFSFIATDDKLGTGPAGTITIRVRPNTTVDLAAPNGSNPVPASNYLGASTSTDAEFSFSSPQSPIASYECRLLNDNVVVEDWVTCASGASGTYDYSGLADGLHRFEVRAVNAEGQKDGTPAFRTWRVDTSPPVTSLRVTPPSDRPAVQPRATNDPTPTYAFQVTDRSPQEFVTYECRILSGPDAGIWKPCASPSTPVGSGLETLAGPGSNLGYPDPFAEGVYEFEVRATDDVGLTGPVLSERFRVDLTPPITSIATGPDGLINYRNVEFAVTSTEPFSTFDCLLTGQSQGVLFNGLCPGGASPFFNGLADDRYTLRITAIDPATNRDPNPPIASFEVDATAPQTLGGDVDFGNGVTNDRLTKSRRITVAFSGTDNRALDGFQCRLDSTSEDAWDVCQPPETYSGLADGAHKLEIRARDEAVNFDPTPLVIEWTVDRTPPTTTITAAPDPVSNDANPQFTFTRSESATSECRVDSGAWTSCSSPASAVALNGGPLGDGPHSFSVRSTDLAGNLEATPASAVWVQDTVVPVVDIVAAPASFSPRGDAEFGWTVKDGSPPADAPEVQTDCRIDGGTWNPCPRTLVVPDPANGAHTFEVRATDGAGNTDTELHSWQVLGAPPIAPQIDNASVAEGQLTRLTTATFAFSHSDEFTPSFGRFECSLDGSTWAACESPHTFSGLNDGPHEFRLRAVDAAGNLGAVLSRTWQVQTGAPVTTIDTAPEGAVRERGATITFSADKPVTFECRLNDGPWEACASPVNLSDLPDGDYTYSVRSTTTTVPVGVTDPTPPSRTWTVDGTPPTTVLDSAPSGSTEDTTAQIAFSSPDADALFQCSLDSAPFNSCTSPVNLSNLPTGPRTFTVRAIDQAGNADPAPQTASWTIVPPPPPECPPGTQGVPPDCEEIPASRLEATLTGGTLSLAALGEVVLPGGQLKLIGQREDDGRWIIPQAGVQFDAIEQTIDAPGVGLVTVKIRISATGPGVGSLPTGGGPASMNLPMQAKLEARLGDVPLIGPDADCFLRPITFDLNGTYDEAGQTVTLGSPGLTFPQVSAGCGALGGTVNDLLELPRSDIALSLDFSLEQIGPVDDVKPLPPSITAGPSGRVNTTAAAFSFEGEPGNTFECRLDAGDWGACTSPKPYTGLAEGAHTFEVRQTNAASKTSDPASRSWTVDTTAPGAPQISSGPSGTVPASNATFAFTGEADAAFDCSLDNGPWERCSAPKSYQSLRDGARSFRVRQTDAAGNVGSAFASRSWEIASTQSRLEATLTGGSLSLAALGEVALPGGQLKLVGQRGGDGSWTVPQSGVQFNPIEQTIDAPGIGAVTVKISITATADAVGSLPAGGGSATFNLPAQAKLEARLGNIVLIGPDADCALRPVVFDLAGTYDQGAKTVALNSPSVSFPQVSAGCGPLGGTVNTLLELPRNDIAISLNFSLEEFGAIDAPQIASGPTGTVNSPNASFSFTGTNGATFECRIDNGPWAACTSPRSYTNLANGQHVFEVRQILEGSTSEAATRTWTVQAEPKVALTVKAPKKLKPGASLTMKVQVRNTGKRSADTVKVCVKSPTKFVTGAASRCVNVKNVAAGKSKTATFKLKTKKGKKGEAKFQVSAEYAATGDGKIITRTGHVTLMK